MVPAEKKRRGPGPNTAPKARKRQKLDSSSTAPRQKHTKSSAIRHAARLDQLQWKEVSLPDRLEDAEGFFGLEEIDDVEVIRGEDGKLSYRITEEAQNTTQKTHATKINDKSKNEADYVEDNDKNNEESLEEEWSGFSEDDALPMAQNGVQLLEDVSFNILGDQKPEEEFDTDVSAWSHIELSPETMSSLAQLGFAKPTTIQSKSIPRILAGHDVIGKASTGSGKTLAFGIPILETFLSTPRGAKNTSDSHHIPLALVLSPTRELAHQIRDHLQKLFSGALDSKAPFIATLTGGLSLQKQQRLLAKADVVIGTPGRLWEVISGGHGIIKALQQIKYLVVDEADRLLSEGHFKEVEQILTSLDQKDTTDDPETEENEINPPTHERQTLIFSATFHKGLQQKLAGKNKYGAGLMSTAESMEYLLKKLNFREEKPEFIDANPVSQMASGLKEGLIECPSMEKDLYLYALLLHHPGSRTLVFTNSISAVRRLSPLLQNLNIPVLSLHSQMAQKARLRAVERFRDTAGSVMIATDVAARGLDIPGVELILHYHLPRTADAYVHRSGRTARAENSGSSILICGPEEVHGVRRLVAKVHAMTQSDNPSSHFIRTVDIDRRVVSRLKPRTVLAKRIADATIAKEKKNSEDDWLRAAAEDLGVEYDSEEFESQAPGRHGRGNDRRKKEREARSITKSELQGLRAELKQLLSKKVNVGVSERYLTRGGVDINALLKGQAKGDFLGGVQGLGMDD